MRGKRFNKVLSMALTTAMVTGLLAPMNVYAERSVPDVQDYPFVVSAEKADGVMNLTEIGTMDWVHVTGDGVERKSGGSGDIVINTETGDSFHDSPVEFTWSDGESDSEKLFLLAEAAATPANATAADVDSFKATDSNASKATDSNAAKELDQKSRRSLERAVKHNTRSGGVFKEGYEFDVKPADSVRCLTFVSGVWQATRELSFSSYDEDAQSEPLYRFVSTAGGSAEVHKIHVLLREGEGLTVTSKVSGTSNGNSSLSGLALYELDMADEKELFKVTDAPDSMNLTKEGTLDWVHPEGEGGGRATSRKDTDKELIIIEPADEGYPINNAGDAKVSISWSDGTPNKTGSNNHNAAVYTYKPGDNSSVGPEITDDSGYRIMIPEAEKNEILQFVSGAWNAEMVVKLFINDEEKAVYHGLSAGGSPNTKLFTIPVSTGDQVTVAVSYLKKSHFDGNVCVSAVTLKEEEEADGFKAKLAELIRTAEELDFNLYLDWTVDMLNHELDRSKALVENDSATEYEYYCEYRFLKAAIDSLNVMGKTYFAYETNPGLTSSFGWEGDLHAPISYIDGSYRLRSRDNIMIHFGVTGITGDIKWYNAEGYLPCFISEFTKAGIEYKIENFADCVEFDGNNFEIAYSRMTAVNKSGSEKALPKVSEELIPLNQAAEEAVMIADGETVVRDYAIAADRFGTKNEWPADERVKDAGDFDTHYDHMRDYWNNRLDDLAEIAELPDETLIDAYKAGYIYTLIIRDDIPEADGTLKRSLHVGENGYDEMFDHDTIGIVASLLTIGDFTYAQDYLSTLPAQLQYDDAKWKYSWPYALYLQRTGDIEFIRDNFEAIKNNTHKVESDRDMGAGGIMKKTFAIDSYGYWTTDNWSALAGLATYRYICEQLGEEEESKWAAEEYKDLLESVNTVLEKTMTDNGISYIPMSMVERNEDGPRSDPRDGNWASMFLFGRWGWDGYLFGAEQSGVMLDQIDATYTYGFERRADLTDTPYNFGGYPHGYFSSAYNAGYGSTALRGEQYRDAGIKAYQFMIQESMSGPFGWWEGVAYPSETSPWDIDHAAGGGGSCQHMWGQSTATKVLFDSLIAAKADNSVIVGRGIPEEWISEDENAVEIQNYPVYTGNRMGYRLTTQGTEVTIEFTGNETIDVSVELPILRNNIKSAQGLTFDNEAGRVNVPAGTGSVVISLYKDGKGNTEEADKASLIELIGEAELLNEQEYMADSWTALKEALEKAKECAGKADASQEDVDASAEALSRAISALVKKEEIPADKNALKVLVDYASGLEADDYTADSWTELFEALNTAKSCMEKADASQAEVDSMAATLQKAIDNLKKIQQTPVDKMALESLINQALEISRNGYTASSLKVFEEALARAQEILGSESASEGDVAESLAELQKAIDGLQKKTSSGGSSHSASSGPKSSSGTWVLNATGWWYKNADGSYPANAWKQVKGVWYYFNADGYMVSGWNLINGTWYYMNTEHGGMCTGWILDSAKGLWYYLDPASGAMKAGWQEIDGAWYYLNEADGGELPLGAAYINSVTPDNFRVDENGRRVSE